MVHEHHHEKQPLKLFASPLLPKVHNGKDSSPLSSDLAGSQASDEGLTSAGVLRLNHNDDQLFEDPEFHRHAEATTSELFYDLFFIANLTTFTSIKEINDAESLKSYVGFFTLLWLTWFSVSLYDVRFSSDSIFERAAKALHFGVMVGFAVIGPSWKPSGSGYNFEYYRALSLILMASRFVLAAQYAVTLWFTRVHKKTRIPLIAIIVSTTIAAIIYGGLTAGFSDIICPQALYYIGACPMLESRSYRAWYIIGICEILVTIGISCWWRVISFKGTPFVQRMSLLTLIILGEGIIVICKAISKIVKNGYDFNGPIMGQLISASMIIYFLYMLYFDHLHDEHFGTVRQQIYSALHFPLHVVLVLVLQGVSLLIIWVVALRGLDETDMRFRSIQATKQAGSFANGTQMSDTLRDSIDTYLWRWVPKGIDVSKELGVWNKSLDTLSMSYDAVLFDPKDLMAATSLNSSFYDAETVSLQAMFSSLSISIPKDKSAMKLGKSTKAFDKKGLMQKYEDRFTLVFDYVFISAGVGLLVMTIIGFLPLQEKQRNSNAYVRLGINAAAGLGLGLICLVDTNRMLYRPYIESAWILPTICLILLVCVVANHACFFGHDHVPKIPFKRRLASKKHAGGEA